MKFSKWWGGGGGGQKIKVAQNGMKHGLVLEFLRSDEIFEIWSENGLVLEFLLTGQQARQHTSGHHSDQISRCTLRDGATKNGLKMGVAGQWSSK